MDWELFRTANDSISDFTDTVTNFIKKCTEDVVPHKNNKNQSKSKALDKK